MSTGGTQPVGNSQAADLIRSLGGPDAFRARLEVELLKGGDEDAMQFLLSEVTDYLARHIVKSFVASLTADPRLRWLARYRIARLIRRRVQMLKGS